MKSNGKNDSPCDHGGLRGIDPDPNTVILFDLKISEYLSKYFCKIWFISREISIN